VTVEARRTEQGSNGCGHETGAYALGPEAGEWLQQATLAIRARGPLDVLRDVIQPFPTFSEIHAAALKVLRNQIAVTRKTTIRSA
jgi:dihydrolipoamide dehydrogenase